MYSKETTWEKRENEKRKNKVIPIGFEPIAYCLEGRKIRLLWGFESFKNGL